MTTEHSLQSHPLYKLRRAVGLSRQQLASEAGVGTRTIYNIELGMGSRRTTQLKVTRAIKQYAPYNPETNYFPELYVYGAKKLPPSGWLWLVKQYGKGRYESAAHYLNEQGYAVPIKDEVRRVAREGA